MTKTMERNKKKMRVSEARGAVVRFLKANPLSTAKEIYAATGWSIGAVMKTGMFKSVMCGTPPQRCWRVLPNPEQKLEAATPRPTNPCGVCGHGLRHGATYCPSCNSSDEDES